ncbi:MAG: hypothetical protein FWD31_13240, partial [Planctomycetaceae bacterium]|nr:hypothetical protein [Planctomycetaceae bacterium]
LQRIVEERVDQGQDIDGAWNDRTAEIEVSQRLTLTPDEYKLSDVVTYVGNGGGLYLIDPFTGDLEITRTYYGAFPNNCGVELRDNGKLYTIAGTGYTPNYYEINQAQVSGSISSISTQIMGKWYWLNNTTVEWVDSSYTVQAMTTSNYGINPYYSWPNFTGSGDGIGYTLSIGSVSNFGNSFYANQTGAIAGYDRNVMFLHDQRGVGITTDRNPPGYRINATSGTNQACASSLPLVQFSEQNGLRSNSETITAMCQGNDNFFYVVTDAGNLYRMINPVSQGWSLSINYHVVGTTVIEVPAMRNNGGGARLEYIGTCKDETGSILNLTGIDAGPRNVEGSAYANKLFLTSTDNRLRAVEPATVNSVGAITYSPCFVGGRTSVSIPAGSNSITFSTFDYNLWHRTSLENDPVQQSPSLVRTGSGDGGDEYPHTVDPLLRQNASWYFGLENPTTQDVWRDTQPGAATFGNRYLTGNEESYNTYNVPGGAYGSLTSNSFSLAGYAPEDLPTLYFTYKTDSDSNGTFNNSHDIPSVYVSVGGGRWEAVAVGNAYAYDGDNNNYWDRTNEAQYNDRRLTYRDNTHIIDILENDNQWRQARIDLSKFAGAKDIRLKFVFSTADGAIGIGETVGSVYGTLITAPTAENILDNGNRDYSNRNFSNTVLPGDNSLNVANSYYEITDRTTGITKTFQFVNGYSLYVAATPGAYGDSFALTINGRVVSIPIDPVASTEQVINRIITTVNNAGIPDGRGGVVTVKRHLDVHGNPTGQTLIFENAETLISNSTGFRVLGGPQDRTLEDIFEMTTTDLVAFLSQPVIPVPFRADMTQSQIAGSITFMTNLAFNNLLWTEINQVTNSDVVIPLVETLLQRIQTMGPTENIINIINSALEMIRDTGSTKAVSYLVALVEKLNVNGKTNIADGGIDYTSLNRELERLYSEAANLALAALRNLRGNLPFNPSDAQNTALDTAYSRLATCIANGMFPNRQDSTRIDPIQILRDVITAFGGNNANEQFVR